VSSCAVWTSVGYVHVIMRILTHHWSSLYNMLIVLLCSLSNIELPALLLFNLISSHDVLIIIETSRDIMSAKCVVCIIVRAPMCRKQSVYPSDSSLRIGFP
jgi:hypothetical protein